MLKIKAIKQACLMCRVNIQCEMKISTAKMQTLSAIRRMVQAWQPILPATT